MRRRDTANRTATNDSSVLRTGSEATYNERRTTVSTQLSISRDDSGDAHEAVMAEEGGCDPVPLSDELRHSSNDLGIGRATSSEGREREADDSGGSSSSDESDSSDDSGDNYPTNAAFRGDGPATNAPHNSCTSVVPSGGALQTPMQPQTGNIATFGSIHVESSSGIHFGNETIYHGPVIIEQHVYDPDDVTQVDGSLKLSVGEGPLAITDGSEQRVELPLALQRSKGLELSSGAFKIGTTAVAFSKGRSGLLLRHLLGRRPGCTTWVVCIALALGCIAVLAVIIAVTIMKPSGRSVFSSSSDSGDNSEQQSRTPLRRSLVEVVPRREWVAQPPKSTTLLKHPVEFVIISHTSSDPCVTQPECALTIRYIQVYHVEGKKFLDISYNFMVAGDGRAYEGRGWDVVGAHTTAGFNGISVGISFVGTFDNELPPPAQIRAVKYLIEEGVKLGKIAPDYKLIADRQVSPSGNPGQKLFDELKTWEHWTADI